MSSITPGRLCGRSAAAPTQATRSSRSSIAALLSRSVPVHRRPIFVRSRTVIVSPRPGSRPRGSGRLGGARRQGVHRSEEHTSELQSRENLVCRLLPEKKKNIGIYYYTNAYLIIFTI